MSCSWGMTLEAAALLEAAWGLEVRFTGIISASFLLTPLFGLD